MKIKKLVSIEKEVLDEVYNIFSYTPIENNFSYLVETLLLGWLSIMNNKRNLKRREEILLKELKSIRSSTKTKPTTHNK